MIDKIYSKLQDERVKRAVEVQSHVRYELKKFLHEKGFVEIPPVIISPLTDPLRHETYEATINYYGHRYSLTKSMIFHKQLALIPFEKIFAFSPNVRLEPVHARSSKRHLAEFTQLDLEMRDATREDIMELVEEMLVHVIKNVKSRFSLDIDVPSPPFPEITFQQAYSKYGKDFEVELSKEMDTPFWIVDMPITHREFYDREYKEGILRDMDLIYPYGFGEAASGGEREYRYERILDRIKRGGYKPEDFKLYLEFAKRGIPRSAGIGIGLERLTRFLCKLKSVEDATLFPKVIGEPGI